MKKWNLAIEIAGQHFEQDFEPERIPNLLKMVQAAMLAWPDSEELPTMKLIVGKPDEVPQ